MIHNDFFIEELKRHATNGLGCLATVSSAAVGSIQIDDYRGRALFAVSFLVGILTAAHMALQIWNIVRHIAKKKV